MNFQTRLREELADIEHQRWSDWQAWCHKILRENCPSPELEKVLERWDRQISTPYKDLSESEKQSDRDQVARYFPIITHLINKAKIDELKELLRQSEVVRVDGKVQSYGFFNATISDRIKELEGKE